MRFANVFFLLLANSVFSRFKLSRRSRPAIRQRNAVGFRARLELSAPPRWPKLRKNLISPARTIKSESELSEYNIQITLCLLSSQKSAKILVFSRLFHSARETSRTTITRVCVFSLLWLRAIVLVLVAYYVSAGEKLFCDTWLIRNCETFCFSASHEKC